MELVHGTKEKSHRRRYGRDRAIISIKTREDMKTPKKIQPRGFKKVVARISTEAYERADLIKEKFGFKSIYEINQYLWHCFLRVADPEHDEEEEPVPDEIKQMFYDLSEADRQFDFVKPKRKLPQYKLDEINGQLRLWEE